MLAAPGAAGELLDFLEGEVRKERAVRNATLIFIKDEWAREEALRRETRAREEALRESALEAAARSLLENRWILVDGDSRGRFLYSALSSLLEPGASRSVDPNGTWPHHWPNRTAIC